MPIAFQGFGEHFGPLNPDRHGAAIDFEGSFAAGSIIESVTYPYPRHAIGAILRVQSYFDAPTTLRVIVQPEPEFFLSAYAAIDQPANTGVMTDAYCSAMRFPDTYYYGSLVTRLHSLARFAQDNTVVNGRMVFYLLRDGSTTNDNEFDVDLFLYYAGTPG